MWHKNEMRAWVFYFPSDLYSDCVHMNVGERRKKKLFVFGACSSWLAELNRKKQGAINLHWVLLYFPRSFDKSNLNDQSYKSTADSFF